MEKTRKIHNELVELINNINCDENSKKELMDWVDKSKKNMERIELKYQSVTSDKSKIDSLLNKTSADLRIALLKAEHKSQKLATILNTTPAAILVKDKDGSLNEKNIQYDAIVSKLNNPNSLLEYLEPFEHKAIKENIVIHDIDFNINSNHYRIQISPFNGQDDNYLGVVIVIVDITELKEKEQDLIDSITVSKEANKAKDLFLANMSHEIRTPMNAIMGMSEYLLRKNIDSEIHDSIKKIKRSSDNLLYIINDILDFSKITSGNFDIELEEFTLEDLIESVVDNCENRLEKSNVNFVIETGENIPYSLTGGYYRYIQILTNLLSNAIKFTERGMIKLRVCFDKESKDNILFIFEVSDTGVGMSDEQKENLFQPFGQVDFSDTRKYGGTGLGLAITKKLVDQMGGVIEYESEVGLGTRFTVKLKIEQSKSKKSKIEILDFNKPIHFFTPHEILRENIKKVVNLSKIDIVTHSSLDSEFNFQNSVLLVDINFNKESIKTFLKSIKEKHSDFSNINIYILQNPNRTIEKVDDPIVSDIIIRKPLTPLKLAKIHSPEAFNDDYEFNRFNKNKITGKNVLVVDDNEINLEVATNLLTDFGINSDVAENGQVALDIFKNNRNKYDLILLDLHMPVLDGYDTIKEIRDLDSSIPVIALTADAIMGMKEKIIEHGFNDLITKPYKGDDFLEIIKLYIFKNESLSEMSVENYIESTKMLETTNTLELLSNNYDLYKGLLLKYLGKYVGVVHRLENEFNEDRNKYFKTIHDLKGVLGTLGAMTMYNLLSEIEKNRENPKLLETNKKDFEENHKKFIDFIENLVDIK